MISRTAMACLELEKVRHSLTLLRGEQESAQKIVDVTKERQGEGFELPVEVTKAQLTRAQVVQKMLQLEGREDELQVFLKGQLGLTEEQEIEVTADDLPGEAEQEGANLVASAMENNTGLQLAASDVRAREFRLQGEKRGYLPTVQLVGVYSYLAKVQQLHGVFQTLSGEQSECRGADSNAAVQCEDQGERGAGVGESGSGARYASESQDAGDG